MKRVLCLYRVSTKGQVDKKDDIPMQRRECMAFIERMEDWCFYDELMEKGVSGYKVSASKRDAILEIRALAEKKKFDVLLVFMFDRLGRREDETPFLVQWFIEHGIEVWSTREGQQRLDSRVDKLLNFMRYWQAGGESEKTSMRVKAAHTQMTADGVWRGGARPFGYKLTHNGRIGKKNRPLYDLSIDEVEGPIVKEVFDLIIHEGYGTLRAANYLNDKYASLGKIWTAQTIRSMLRNVIYTGRMHMNDTQSAPIESLRIISDEEKENTAYHEVGHALLAKLLKNCDPLHKVSIIPRGMALGITLTLPEKDHLTMRKNQLLDRIAMILGGRVAEELIYGKDNVTTGASNDLEKVSNLARSMVTTYGMSEKMGNLAYGKDQEHVFMGRNFGNTRDFSEEIAADIDKEVKKIVDKQYDYAMQLLSENRDMLEHIAKNLLEKETLDEKEFEDLMNEVKNKREGEFNG